MKRGGCQWQARLTERRRFNRGIRVDIKRIGYTRNILAVMKSFASEQSREGEVVLFYNRPRGNK